MQKNKEHIPTYKIEELIRSESCAAPKDFDLYRFEDFQQGITPFLNSHRHNFYMLLLCSSGKGAQDIDFKTYQARQYRVFLMQPGQIHRWREIEELKGYILFFTKDFFELRYQSNMLQEFPFFNSSLQEPYLDLNTESYSPIEQFLLCMEEEYKHKNTLYRQQIIRSCLNVLLCKLSRFYLPQEEEQKRKNSSWLNMRKFEQLIEEHFRSKHGVKDYAALLFLTPNYLNSLCSQCLGISAGEFIRQRIMLEAKRLLCHSDMQISEIAYHLGFQDHAYFSRFFKKYSSTNPEQFRQKVKLGLN